MPQKGSPFLKISHRLAGAACCVLGLLQQREHSSCCKPSQLQEPNVACLCKRCQECGNILRLYRYLLRWLKFKLDFKSKFAQMTDLQKSCHWLRANQWRFEQVYIPVQLLISITDQLIMTATQCIQSCRHIQNNLKFNHFFSCCCKTE